MHSDPFNPNAFHAIMAILCMLVGLGIGIGGYRFQRFAMPACVLFITGDYVAMIITALVDGLAHEYEYWIAFFVGGLAFAGAAMIRAPIGAALTGFSAGIVLTAMLLDMGMYTESDSTTVPILMMTIVGALVGALTFLVRRFGLIGTMSFAGAYVLMDGIRHFVNVHVVNEYEESRSRYSYSSSRTAATKRPTYSLSDKIRTAWWKMCATTLVLFVAFAAVQQFVTARGVNHEQTKTEDEATGHEYTDSNTPSGGRNQLAPVGHPVAIV